MGHDCRVNPHLVTLEILFHRHGPGSYASLTVERCLQCGQLWLVRAQWDAGTGDDTLWIKPGESVRGYEFTHEEAAKYALAGS